MFSRKIVSVFDSEKNLGKGLGKLSFRKKVSVSEKSLGFVQNFRQTAGNQMEAKKTSRDLLALVGDTKTNTLIHKQKMKKGKYILFLKNIARIANAVQVTI